MAAPKRSLLPTLVHPARALRTVWRASPVGSLLVASLIVMGMLGPWIARGNAFDVQMAAQLRPPGPENMLGTDEFGRDVLTRVVLGARIAVTVALLSISISTLIGVPLGFLAGFYGGRLDFWISRVIDSVLSFPVVLMALTLAAVWGPSPTVATVAIGIARIPGVVRVTRGTVINVAFMEYVESARAAGATDFRIFARTILPNCLAVILVPLSYYGAEAVLWESSLSFLGLGTQPPAPSWGSMLRDAKGYLYNAPWYAVSTGIALMSSIIGLNLLGDGLRAILVPSSRDR